MQLKHIENNHDYFVTNVCVQPRLAQEILELSDITSSTRTQQQQPLFILSLWMKRIVVLVSGSSQNNDWVGGKDVISYCNGVESLSAHCDREDVLSLVEVSQAADH